ncbi:TauD/TfdA family dioxygenase [Nostoc linckia FACHB-104]|nr:TauD/TfdA family dioxygenase [Nostoc linckia FACHB-104]
MNIKIQPISNSMGQQIINAGNHSIWELSREEIISLFKEYGALLFRGFATNVGIFTEFSNSLSTDFRDYTGGVFQRRIINGDKTVLSVNNFKSAIKLHGEMYYQKNIPLMLWFFCEHPASAKGETTICDGRQFYNELSSATKDLFSKNHIKFTAHLSEAEWQKQYKTEDVNQVAEICELNDTRLTIYQDNSIVTEYIRPAIIPSSCGKHQVFINSLLPGKHLYPERIRFADDSDISDTVMSELNEIAERLTTEISWQTGDILMIDNTRILHGRRAFDDDKRDIYVRLCAPAFSMSSQTLQKVTS